MLKELGKVATLYCIIAFLENVCRITRMKPFKDQSTRFQIKNFFDLSKT